MSFLSIPSSWPLVQKALEKDLLSYFDLLYAKTHVKQLYIFEKTALCLCYLSSLFRKGHLCLQIKEGGFFPKMDSVWEELLSFQEWKKAFFSLPKELVEEVKESSFFPEKPLCRQKECFYLQKAWVYEMQVRKNLERIFSFSINSIKVKTEKNLLPSQKKAVEKVFSSPFTLLTGGPGTGKTYTASFLLKAYKAYFPEHLIAVAAPTGKAAFHLQEKLHFLENLSTQTLHTLLGVSARNFPSFSSPFLPYDLILVDESSMIDAKIMALLLAKIKQNSRLVLMGDPHQLPPVEAGSFFSDFCKTYPFLKAELDVSIRFEKKELLSFSKAVLEGEKATVFHLLQNASSLQKLSWSFSQPIAESFFSYIKPFYSLFSKKPFDLKQLFLKENKFQILSPLRQGLWGADALNQTVFEKLFEEIPFSYFWAAPILITKNFPEKNLFNGMKGFLIGKKTEKNPSLQGEIFLSQKGKILSFSPAMLPFSFSYVISVHKSQGSEYEQVLLILPEKSKMAGREIFYTAATRAKKKLTIWGKDAQIISLLDSSLEKFSSLS